MSYHVHKYTGNIKKLETRDLGSNQVLMLSFSIVFIQNLRSWDTDLTLYGLQKTGTITRCTQGVETNKKIQIELELTGWQTEKRRTKNKMSFPNSF